MKKKIMLFATLFLVVAMFQSKNNALYAADCGKNPKISIAEMTWASASMYAHLVKIILNDGYGCKSRLVPGDTVSVGASILAKGSPSIAPELWASSLPKILEETKKPNGKIFTASESFVSGGVEGLWVPDYVYNDMGVKSVYDLAKNWKLFTEPASPKKGRFYGCPPGWVCEITTTNLFKALGLEDTFDLFSPGSGGALKASLAKRVNAKQPVVGWYWDPTAVIGRYNLVKLDTNPYNVKDWNCISDPECDDPKVVDFPSAPVLVVAVSSLKKNAPDVVGFLRNLSIPNIEVAAILGWADKSKSTGEESAIKFLQDKQDIWREWVPEDVAMRIVKSL